jgi:ABC-type taurine transport system substrate-binding protein
MGRADLRRLDRAQGLRREEPADRRRLRPRDRHCLCEVPEGSGAWVADKANVEKVARVTGSKPEDVAGLLASYGFPTLDQQVAILGNDTVKAVVATATFLKEQGKVPDVLSDYGPYVNADFARQAAATN